MKPMMKPDGVDIALSNILCFKIFISSIDIPAHIEKLLLDMDVEFIIYRIKHPVRCYTIGDYNIKHFIIYDEMNEMWHLLDNDVDGIEKVKSIQNRMYDNGLRCYFYKAVKRRTNMSYTSTVMAKNFQVYVDIATAAAKELDCDMEDVFIENMAELSCPDIEEVMRNPHGKFPIYLGDL